MPVSVENKVARLVDEVIHIASVFSIAGFSHFIGSMWPSRDDVCARIANLFSASLVEPGSKWFTEGFTHALHSTGSASMEGRRSIIAWKD